MPEYWIVESEKHGTESYKTFISMMQRLRELCDVLPRSTISVKFPESADPEQRRRIEELGFKRQKE